MESYFKSFRSGIIGINHTFLAPDGTPKPIIYADWTASGRSYGPLEERLIESMLPLVGNTHTETSTTGTAMTHAYHLARRQIKAHVKAGPEDVLIAAGSGMTRLMNKFQRILGLRGGQGICPQENEADRPVVFITHMEHHSNQTNWLETDATLEIIQPDEEGLVDLDHFSFLLEKHRNRSMKIASVTACSNVTGIETPYHEIARMIHAEGGYCFVDFACSAPYVDINMHPGNGADLDAVVFSPHKFLGGPGSAAVLVFSSHLYQRMVPDNPGGGTVRWTNPWGGHRYIENIEEREDGGTPAFLQTIRTAMAISLKEEMGTRQIRMREHALLHRLWDQIDDIPNLHILAHQHKTRLPIISLHIDGLHYNLGVRLLNDKFGIQSRGGCSCAGTYGHYLLNLDPKRSRQIMEEIMQGDYSHRPGWMRLSLHPTMTYEEVDQIAFALRELAEKHQTWAKAYLFDPAVNLLHHADVNLDAKLKSTIKNSLERPFVERKFFRM